MPWDYGNTIDTVVGGLVTIKVMDVGMKMIDRASNTSRKKSSKKKSSKAKYHNFGTSLY